MIKQFRRQEPLVRFHKCTTLLFEWVLNAFLLLICSHYIWQISQVIWQQEAMAREELLLHASSIREEREQIEESAIQGGYNQIINAILYYKAKCMTNL